MLKDELVDWTPGSVAGAWLTMPFPEPLVGTAVDDEEFEGVMVCSKVSSCVRSRVRNLS